MKIQAPTLLLNMFLSGLLLVPTAFADSSDIKYCEALADKYDTYIDTAGNTGGRPTPMAIQKAMDDCKTNPASAIPVLEKTLKDARFTLPPRN